MNKLILNKDMFDLAKINVPNNPYQYNIDNSWKRIENINSIPKKVPLEVRKCIVDFESESDNFKDKNEWGKSYNLTTNENYGLKTDGHPHKIILPTTLENTKDILFTAHTHYFGSPPSITDIFRCISNNSLKFVSVNSYFDVFLMESFNKPIDKNDLELINEEYGKCYKLATKNHINKNINIFDGIKINFISSEVLNNYIEFYWWYK